MKKVVFSLILAPLAAISLLLSGCTVLAVGTVVGTVVYIDGELVSYVSGDVFEAVDATNAAAADLRIVPTSRTGDQTKAVFNGFGPDGKKVTIKLLPERPGVTKVKIRVGLGDKHSSRQIFNAIEHRMPRI